MKAKKLILLSLFFQMSLLDAGTMIHTLVSVTEHKVLGHSFKHVMTSGGADKDEFLIDGRKVSQEDYLTQLDAAQAQERHDDLMRQQAARRSRIEFADMMQVQIAAKLLNAIISEMLQLFDRIENPALAQFFVFSPQTIESQHQLVQLKNFVQSLDASIDAKIEAYDFQGLSLLCNKLEFWPFRLEKFFQDTVQHAIKKSDDTIMLKELLKLVSESSLIN